MADVTIDEIRQQEEELFEAECLNLSGGMQAKTKALQQLAVSEDSPFNLTSSTQSRQLAQTLTIDREQIRIRDEKARLLREETEEIKRQLDLVKSHLNEFNLVGPNQMQLHDESREGVCCCSRHQQEQQPCRRFKCDIDVKCVQSHKCDQQCQTDCRGRDATGQAQLQPIDSLSGTGRQLEESHVINQQRTSADSQFYHGATSNSPDGPNLFAPTDTQVNPTKFRPLTGKTDCPNCVCDRRRSVCDKCIILQKNVVQQQSSDQKQLADSARSKFIRQPSLLTDQKLTKLNSTLQQAGAQANDGIETDKSKGNHHDDRPIRPAKRNLEELLDEQAAAVVESSAAPMIRREVDQVVVPNTIYTIGKSLNDKRTKLAQAIQELQDMTERVRKRGDRLEQERQVAKLYRDQWKFGPQIGGAKSASRESLKATSRSGTNSTNYLSRLDPNLARDTKSMMGFQHVEPTLKLRQHEKNAQSSLMPPKPMPRFSKLTTNSRPAVLVARGNYRRPTQSSALHSRSKSLESLARQTPARPAGARPRQQAQNSSNNSTKTTTANRQASSGPQRGLKTPMMNGISRAKSSPEVNVVPEGGVEDDTIDSLSGQAVEENLEDELREDELESLRSDTELQGDSLSDDPRETSPGKGASKLDKPSQTGSASGVVTRREEASATNQRPEQRGWIPVFGETEIKTVNRRAPERKVIVINGSTSGFASTRRQAGMQARATNANSTTRSILRTGSTNATTRHSLGSASAETRLGPVNDSVLSEARKKLQFATDLLETDQLDSRTRNQLIVKRQQRSTARPADPLRARPVRMGPVNVNPMQQMGPTQRRIGARSRLISSDESPTTTTTTTTSDTAQSSILSANKEISRLESMISEQQKLLLKLTSASDQDQAGHGSCSPLCSSCRRASSSPCCGRTRQTSRQLISNLRDRLNKTRTRLARTLEEERAKHQRLEQRFDSSLRKQSDLEAENELLKRSLSKCIDTCLKDISNTFESLSEHLNESARGIEADNRPASPTSPIGPNSNRVQIGGPIRTSSGGGGDDSETTSLANAAQLIADNSHLRRMKVHMETIEEQRRGIFEELKQERDRSQQLELELQQSRMELDQLIEAKQRLEMQLHTSGAKLVDRESELPMTKNDLNRAPNQGTDSQVGHSDAENKSSNQKSTRALDTGENETDLSQCPQQLTSENSLPSDDPTSMTFSSIDMYRQFIQSMTPDFDGIRRERRMILNEFDNIKRMLSDMEI